MKAIKIPFSFKNGGVTETTDITLITEQRITDVLVTNSGERAINTGYGAGVRSLIYEPLDTLAFDDYKEETLRELNEVLDSGHVVDFVMNYPDSYQLAYPEDSVVEITVKYLVPPYNGREFSFNVSSDI